MPAHSLYGPIEHILRFIHEPLQPVSRPGRVEVAEVVPLTLVKTTAARAGVVARRRGTRLVVATVEKNVEIASAVSK
jgi:hypothetical protein